MLYIANNAHMVYYTQCAFFFLSGSYAANIYSCDWSETKNARAACTNIQKNTIIRIVLYVKFHSSALIDREPVAQKEIKYIMSKNQFKILLFCRSRVNAQDLKNKIK